MACSASWAILRWQSVTTTHAEFYRGVELASGVSAANLEGGPAEKARAVLESFSCRMSALTPRQPVACKSGCAHCCRYPVGVSYGEALLLAKAVAADPGLRQKLLQSSDSTSQLQSHELVGLACPLLEGDVCAVYSLRPVPCRALASADASACAAALLGPAAVPRDELAYWQGLGVSNVLSLDHPEGLRELRSAVACLLASEDPDAFLRSRMIG
jgi:hypothetical protein